MRLLDAALEGPHPWRGPQCHSGAEACGAGPEPAAARSGYPAEFRTGSRAWRSAVVGGGPGAASSFIRRCWYSERGCDESSTCSDVRALFEAREEVAKLPPPERCKNPKYIVTGTRFREGFMEPNRLETLEFPGEEWHKCCVTEGEHQKFLCQAVEAIPMSKLMQDYHGWCGAHFCIGTRDRCLIVNKVSEHITAKKRGECPRGCPRDCQRDSQRLECVYVGSEPPAGQEGKETPVGGRFDEPLHYDVYSLRAPALAALLLRPPPRPRPSVGNAGCLCQRPAWSTARHRERWERFLA